MAGRLEHDAAPARLVAGQRLPTVLILLALLLAPGARRARDSSATPLGAGVARGRPDGR